MSHSCACRHFLTLKLLGIDLEAPARQLTSHVWSTARIPARGRPIKLQKPRHVWIFFLQHFSLWNHALKIFHLTERSSSNSSRKPDKSRERCPGDRPAYRRNRERSLGFGRFRKGSWPNIGQLSRPCPSSHLTTDRYKAAFPNNRHQN